VLAASIEFLIPGIPPVVAILSFSLFIIVSEVLIPYRIYVRLLKCLVISMVAFVVTAIIIGGSFEEIFLASIIPYFELTPSFMMMLIAIFGATLSPYGFFWMASQEAEEDVAKGKIIEISAPRGNYRISQKKK
jgi:Mn2+/Fe2+ NRAMP family transporter